MDLFEGEVGEPPFELFYVAATGKVGEEAVFCALIKGVAIELFLLVGKALGFGAQGFLKALERFIAEADIEPVVGVGSVDRVS